MRLHALLAFAALVGLSACDSAKVSELTGSKPATAQIAPGAAAAPGQVAQGACPPAPAAPVCPPSQPSMAPEAPKAAPAAGVAIASKPVPAAAVHRAKVRAHAWAPRHHVTYVRHVAPPAPRHHKPPVRRFVYAGGYTGGETAYAPAPQVYVERHEERRYVHPPVYGHPPIYGRPPAYGRADEGRYRYEHREDGYAQGGAYREDRRESVGHAPYVDGAYAEGRRDQSGYRYERRESSSEQQHSSSYEHVEGGSSSYGGGYGSRDDCNCRPQAAGRDRQGFLTWPGKR